MSEEEIKKFFKDNNFDNTKYGFDTPKKSILTYNVIAWFNNKKMKITKVTKNKCIEKVITYKGLDVSRFSIDRNYNDNLEHKNGKIKIIDFEII